MMTYLLAHSVALVTTWSLSLGRVGYLGTLGVGVALPVQTNTEHSIVPQSRHEQILVLPAFTKHREGPVRQRDLPHPAPVPVGQGLRRAVSPPEPRPLRQDELQLWSGSSSYQGPDQGQRVLVEVSLK